VLEKTVQEVNLSSTSTAWGEKFQRKFGEYSLQDTNFSGI